MIGNPFVVWYDGFSMFVSLLLTAGEWLIYYTPVLAFPLIIWVNVIVIRLAMEIFG